MAQNVDITMLAKLCQETLAETKAARRELGDVRVMAEQTVEYLRNMEKRHETRFTIIDKGFHAVDQRIAVVDQRLSGIDQRITDLKDDLELIIRAELSGRLTNFETKIDERLARIEQRLNGATHRS
jgi:hypothetical protein